MIDITGLFNSFYYMPPKLLIPNKIKIRITTCFQESWIKKENGLKAVFVN